MPYDDARPDGRAFSRLSGSTASSSSHARPPIERSTNPATTRATMCKSPSVRRPSVDRRPVANDGIVRWPRRLDSRIVDLILV